MKIAMWSPSSFSGRKSSNLLLFAMQAISEEGGEQFVIHADPEGSGPEHFLLSGSYRRRMMNEKEFGVEFLASRMRCERFSKELAINAAYTFAEGKLHILPPGRKGFYVYEKKETADMLSRIIANAGEVFRNVWIELPAGISFFTEQILSEVDCVIVNLVQSPLETEKMKNIQVRNNAFFLVGAYEQRNILSVHNLELMYPQLKGRCMCIPYHPDYLAACCAGEAEVFWLREGMQKDASAFCCAVQKAYDRWKARCGTERCE